MARSHCRSSIDDDQTTTKSIPLLPQSRNDWDSTECDSSDGDNLPDSLDVDDAANQQPQPRSPSSWMRPRDQSSHKARLSSEDQTFSGLIERRIGKLLMAIGAVQIISLLYLAFGARSFDRTFDIATTSDGRFQWPTDFSRDVQPVPCHSHNDYWRARPVYDAVLAGCTSIEADVWLIDDELFVGHSRASLTRNRTLDSLYIEPLTDILHKQNPITELNPEPSSELHGVFDTDATQSLVLLIDFKTDGSALWPHVVSQLEHLRQRGFLTHFDGKSLVSRPITVVATGNAPFDLVTSNSTYRDIFFDAPLDNLFNGGGDESSGANTASSPYDSTNSFFASTSFRKNIGSVWWTPTSEQMDSIRIQIDAAHHRGLKARYWETPSWPKGLRNHVWNVLVKEGVDYLNVDDLKAATQGTWN